MASCVDLLQGLEASCDALNKIGGVKKRAYVGQLSQLDSYSTDGSGYIDGLTFVTASPAYGLYKFSGKKAKNSGTYELSAGENVNTWNTSVILELYHNTPTDREAIEGLVNSDDLFVILETESGQLEVFGITQGLNASAGSGGTGVALQDKTSTTITLSGEQMSLPKYFLDTDLATSIAALDALVV